MIIKNVRRLGKRAGLIAAVGAALSGAHAGAADYGLALVLDGSSSIYSSDFSLQTGAYQSIFQDDFYSNYIVPGLDSGDTFMVSAYQFSTGVVQEIGYTLIDSDASAYDFGSEFSNISQQYGSTNTADAVEVASADLVASDYDAMIIDISTDGYPNSQAAAIDAAEIASDQGVAVNALGVGFSNNAFLDESTSAGGGFYLEADSFDEFQDTLAAKLAIETGSGGLPQNPMPPGVVNAVPEINGATASVGGSLVAILMLLLSERRRFSSDFSA